MPKRSGKFYYKNERETLESLGLKQVKGSGSGWVEKEDGENEYILAQLKSTDAQSISVKMLDIEKLEYHANVSHKIPVFIVQFLQTNDVYIMARPEDIPSVAKYIETGICDKPEVIQVNDSVKVKPTKTIKSSSTSRKKFWEDRDAIWRNHKK